jgi:hypothetical protein
MTMSKREGIAEGRTEERAKTIESAKLLLSNGIPPEVIVKSMNFTADEISQLSSS